jgi:hypothetical protein
MWRAIQASPTTETTATADTIRSRRWFSYRVDMGGTKLQGPPRRRAGPHPTSSDLRAISLMSGCSEIEADIPGMRIAGRRPVGSTMRPRRLSSVRPTVANTEPLRLSAGTAAVKRRLKCFARKSRSRGTRLVISAAERRLRPTDFTWT